MVVKLSGNQAGGREERGRDKFTPNRYSAYYLGNGHTYKFDSNDTKAIHVTNTFIPP